MRTLLAALSLVPAAALAGGSSFDGTWKARADSIRVSGRPDSFLLADGTYTCSSCNPELKVKADGAEHAVTGHAYYDSVTVKVLDPSSIEITYHRVGRVISMETDSVSADGKTYTAEFVNYDGSNEVNGSITETRVGTAPAGAHAISGEWRQDQLSASDAGMIVSYEMTGGHFKMRANGQSYDGKFDGKEYPITGDPGHTTVTLKRIAANVIEETVHRQGKVTDVSRIATAADGKTLEIEDHDIAHGQTMTVTLDKQP